MTFSRGPVSTLLICGVAYRWRSKEAPRDVRGDVQPAAAKREEAGRARRARRGIERANTIMKNSYYYSCHKSFPIDVGGIGRVEVRGVEGVVVVVRFLLLMRFVNC